MFKLVTYDLAEARETHISLIAAIRTYVPCARVTGSTWLIHSTRTAQDVFGHLQAYLDDRDRLFVADLAGDATWVTGVSPATDIKAALSPRYGPVF